MEHDPIRDRALAVLLELAEDTDTQDDLRFSAAQTILYDSADRERIKVEATKEKDKSEK